MTVRVDCEADREAKSSGLVKRVADNGAGIVDGRKVGGTKIAGCGP